jgi:hypothetical protein
MESMPQTVKGRDVYARGRHGTAAHIDASTAFYFSMAVTVA